MPRRLPSQRPPVAGHLQEKPCSRPLSAPAAPVNGVLASPAGATLYTFDKDAANSGKSACNGPCAMAWPPLAAQPSDAPNGDYTIFTRDDGSRQWAYKGWP